MKVIQATKAPGPCTLILNTDVGEVYLTPAKPLALVQGWTLDPWGQGVSRAFYPTEETEEVMVNMTDNPVLVELARRAGFAEPGEAIPVPTERQALEAANGYYLDGSELKKKK